MNFRPSFDSPERRPEPGDQGSGRLRLKSTTSLSAVHSSGRRDTRSSRFTAADDAEAEQLTQDQIAELKETFNLFDKDGDGHVTVSELIESCQQMGLSVTDTEAKQMADEIDDDRDGTIDFAEFLQYITIQMKDAETNDEVMRLAYQEFDRGSKGYISAEDVHRMMGILEEEISVQEIQAILKECDQDGDGQIDFGGQCFDCCFSNSLHVLQLEGKEPGLLGK